MISSIQACVATLDARQCRTDDAEIGIEQDDSAAEPSDKPAWKLTWLQHPVEVCLEWQVLQKVQHIHSGPLNKAHAPTPAALLQT